MPLAEVLDLDVCTFGGLVDSLARIEAGRHADLAMALAAGQSSDGLEDYLKIKNWEMGFEREGNDGAALAKRFGGGF